MTPFSEATDAGQSLTIQLTNGAQAVREIYFADGRRNVLSYNLTRGPLMRAVLFAGLSALFYLLSFSNQVSWIFLLYLSMLGFVTFAVAFTYRANKYFEWKRSVNKYLKEIASHKEWSLTLRGQTFEVVNENATSIEKWQNIKKASLSATRVILTSESGDQYLFPAKAMDEKDYEALSLFVKEKVK